MKKGELIQVLKMSDVRSDSYSFEGGFPNEAYCFNYVDGVWEVYYSERGNKTGLKQFEKEEEACEYFYTEIMNP